MSNELKEVGQFLDGIPLWMGILLCLCLGPFGAAIWVLIAMYGRQDS